MEREDDRQKSNKVYISNLSYDVWAHSLIDNRVGSSKEF